MKPRVLGIIPARWGSTRLPGKMLADIAGKPLIIHTLLNTSRAASLDAVIVATDDERIAVAVEAKGFEAVMTDPELPSGSDRIWEAARRREADIIVNVQGDEPLLPVAVIDRSVEMLIERPDLEVTTASCPLSPDRWKDPSAVKVVVAQDGRALYFSRAPIPFSRSAQIPVDLLKLHVGLYVYRRDTLRNFCSWDQTPLEKVEKLEQLRLLEHNVPIGVVDVPGAGRGVDTEEDLLLVRKALGG